MLLVLLSMGFSYQEAMELPEDDAAAFCEAYAELKTGKKDATYKVNRPKREKICPKA